MIWKGSAPTISPGLPKKTPPRSKNWFSPIFTKKCHLIWHNSVTIGRTELGDPSFCLFSCPLSKSILIRYFTPIFLWNFGQIWVKNCKFEVDYVILQLLQVMIHSGGLKWNKIQYFTIWVVNYDCMLAFDNIISLKIV